MSFDQKRQRIHVTAHSGAENTPDNSLEFLQTCVRLGFEIAEIDVTFRADGTPVLMHASAAGEQDGVLFADAVAYIASASDSLRLNLDLKSVENLPAIVKILEENEMLGRCFFTGVKEAWTEKVRTDTDGKVPYYLNYSFAFWKRYSAKCRHEALRRVRDCGAVGINCAHRMASHAMVELFRKNGLLTSFWTVNSERDMRRLIAFAPDNLTSRRPVRLLEILNQ